MKPFKTIDEQINILKDRGLVIDLKNANEILFKEGYYNIINGYKDIFLEDSEKETFITSTKFSDIYILYHFDNLLRHNILNVCISIENILKTVIAYYISKEYDVFEDSYLDRNNYRSGRIKVTSFGSEYEIDAVLRNLNEIKQSNSQPYKHYKEKHGHIPAWILLKGANFWTIKTFLKLQKSDIKDMITSTLLDKNLDYINVDDKQFLSDIVHIIYKFRNCAAHGGRMYNLNIKRKTSNRDSDVIKYYKTFHDKINISSGQYNKGCGQSDFYAFYYAVKQLLPSNEYLSFNRSVIALLKAIKTQYGDKYSTVLKMMGVPMHMLNMPEEMIFM